MLFVDVNVLVYAHRLEAPRHTDYKAWLESARTDDEPLALADQVLAGFVRVVTHPKVFKDPSPPESALAFAEALRSSPAVLVVQPSERTWSLFHDLVIKTGAKGNSVPDAFLAAMALDLGAIFCTADRGFARFGPLQLRHPV